MSREHRGAMKTFIGDNFLLHTRTARELYRDWAAPEPIFDYHCHLPPEEIASDRRYADMAELWLGGDHYKWRAMRTNGISERFCTGDAPPYEKFFAFARTLPMAVRNPLYHWSHLELLRYFGIDDLLDERSAPDIWERANAELSEPGFSARGLVLRSRVAAICTTDDPASDLQAHRQLSEDPAFEPRVYPTFRPDQAMTVHRPEVFREWIGRLERAADGDCVRLEGFIEALERRHAAFHELGCRLSDHGLEMCPARIASPAEAAAIYANAMAGRAATEDGFRAFVGFVLDFIARRNAARGWTMQLHLGALRGVNSRRGRELGPDTGFDSIGDWRQAGPLAAFLDQLEADRQLPRVIIYNLNPADNYLVATMAGNFQDGETPGKIQFGSGWWFLDQKDGMEWQMNALSKLGLLSRFVGMVTDSRSFLSYTRHEYFRRILCNLIGQDIEAGELPADMELLGGIVKRICFRNTVDYLGLEPGRVE